MRITVVGLGFVGLTTALGFADKGIKVYGFDVDEDKINSFKNCEIPFHEPNLKQKLIAHLNKNFIIVESLSLAINESDAVFICVGTPYGKDGKAELKYVKSSIHSIISSKKKNNKFTTIVIKSTVPPSTTLKKIKPMIEEITNRLGTDIGLANNPEFLREGYAWLDFTNPDRIVIGTEDKNSAMILEKLYEVFEAPIVKVNLNTAEFIKYLSNTLLATMISYSNEMSILADYIGEVDIKKSFQTLHLDKRWYGHPANMATYVFPGAGFGGYCLPKDTAALLSQGVERGYKSKFLEASLDINKLIKVHLANKVFERVNKNKKIGILGLSFKPDSDDVRDTPVKDFINQLISLGYSESNIYAYDPMAIKEFRTLYTFNINYIESLDEIVSQSDIFVVLTGWKEFSNNYELLKSKPIFDFRYIF